jgi:hypothetical protein
LDATFPNRSVGRDGPTPWPPRSPDITPLDFFLWGYVKDKVYSTYSSFLVINVCNQGKTLCSPCISHRNENHIFIKINITTGAMFVSGSRHRMFRMYRRKEYAEIVSVISMFHDRRQLGRPIRRWKGNIKMDPRGACEEKMDWINLA